MARQLMLPILCILALALSSVSAMHISGGARRLLGPQFLQPDLTNQLVPGDHQYMHAFAHTVNALTFSPSGYVIAPATTSKALTVLPSGSLALVPLQSARNQQWRLGPVSGSPGHHLFLRSAGGQALCMDGDNAPKLGRSGKAVTCSSALTADGIAFIADSYARLCTAYGNNAAFRITVRSNPDYCLALSLQWQPCSDEPQQMWCQVPPQ